MDINYSSYIKIFLALVLLTVLIVPALYAIISNKSRLWLKSGIEGDNKRLDMDEIWEIIYMFIAIGSFLTLIFMIINKSLFATDYTWEEYSLVFLGTAGSNGVAAWVIWLKNKNNPPKQV